MLGKLWLATSALSFIMAACVGRPSEGSELTPSPRDLTAPGTLSGNLARARVPWWRTQGGVERGYIMHLDGSDPISPPQGCETLSPSERYFACAPFLGITTLDIVDRNTGARRVLVQKEAKFPGAVALRDPAFSLEESFVLFSVAWPDHTGLAMVDVNSGAVAPINAPGLTNLEPRLSPDGRLILVGCEGTRAGAGFVLCLIDRERHTRTYLVDEALNLMPGSRFSADGRFVVYVAPVGGIFGEGQLYRIGLDNRKKVLLVSGLRPSDVVLATTSDDVAFTCSLPEHPACSWVCVVGLDGRDVRRLTYLGEHCIDVNAP